MIFSHMQKPLGMRKTRIGKRISVQGVPVGTIWFCPYCCATVDTPFRHSYQSNLGRLLLEGLNGRGKRCQQVIAAYSSDNLS